MRGMIITVLALTIGTHAHAQSDPAQAQVMKLFEAVSERCNLRQSDAPKDSAECRQAKKRLEDYQKENADYLNKLAAVRAQENYDYYKQRAEKVCKQPQSQRCIELKAILQDYKTRHPDIVE